MIRFDAERAIKDFQVRLFLALKQLQQEYLKEARSHQRTPEAFGDLKEGEMEAVAGWIAMEVVGGPLTVMDNYGRGSLMDTRNPAFKAYRSSELWNPARPGLDIRSRPKGPYIDIFGRRRIARGPGGIPLEGIGMEGRRHKFSPWPPSYALETAARWLKMGRVQEVIQNAVQTFDWDNYIIIHTGRGGRR